MNDVFSEIYHTNYWQDKHSLSGPGSNLKATATIRKKLPTVFAHLGIKSLLDIPCGDFYWFDKMWDDLELEKYIGADIVPELIFDLRNTFIHRDIEFQKLNAISDRLPRTDMILCRDMLGHLPNLEAYRAIKNFERSGATWLLATTFPNHENGNIDINAGQWRPINLADYKFGLGEPMLVIDENCTEGTGEYADKALGLWRLN